jgi:hypothetical protein
VKWIIYLLLIIGIAGIAEASCCAINQNCTIIENCQAGNCGVCSIGLYYPNGTLIESGDMGNLNTNLYEYNASYMLEFGTYPYVINCSTGASCIAGDCSLQIKQTCEEIEMTPIAIIIMIPIFIAFFYLALSYLLRGKGHWAFSIALLLLSFIEFFRAYSYGVVTLVKYYNFHELQDLIGTGTYSFGLMYGVVIAYFMLHMIIIITLSIWDKKRNKIGEYGEYEW